MDGLKVLFVNDFTVQQWLGGAQLEVEFFMDVGRTVGNECILVTPETYHRDAVLNSDLVILNNIMKFSDEEINWVIKQKPYIRWEHDYSFTQPERENFFVNIFKNSICNIFLSPLHLGVHKEQIPFIDKSPDNYVMPSPMNADLFRDLKLERDMDFLYVGRLSPVKGIANVLTNAVVNPEKKFFFAGTGEEEVKNWVKSIKNCTLLGEIPNEKMAEVYSRAKILIHLPEWSEPFGQIVVQAKLCNCALFVNQRIGAFGFGWFYLEPEKMRAALKQAPLEGWEKVHEVYESLTNRPKNKEEV